MKLFTSALLLAILASSYGYTYIIPFNSDSNCYFNGRLLPRGITKIPEACQTIHCRDDGSMLVQGCNDPECKSFDPYTFNKPDVTYYKCVDEQGNSYVKQWVGMSGAQAYDPEEESSGEDLVRGLLHRNRMSRDVGDKEYEKQIKKDRKHAKKLIREQYRRGAYGPLTNEYHYQRDDDEENYDNLAQVQDNVQNYGRQGIVDQIRDDDNRRTGYGSLIQGGLRGYQQQDYADQDNEEVQAIRSKQNQVGLNGGSRYLVRNILGALATYGPRDYLTQGRNILSGLSGYNGEGDATQTSRIHQDVLSGYTRGTEQDLLNEYTPEGYVNRGNIVSSDLGEYRQKTYAGQGNRVQDDLREYIPGYGNQGSIVSGGLSGYRQKAYVSQGNGVQDDLRNYIPGYGNQGSIVQGGLSGYRQKAYASQGVQDDLRDYIPVYTNQGGIVSGGLSGYRRNEYTGQEKRNQDDLRDYISGQSNQGSIVSGRLGGYRHKGYTGKVNAVQDKYNSESYVNQPSTLQNRNVNQGRRILSGLDAYAGQKENRDFEDQGYLSDYTGGVDIIYTNKAIKDQNDEYVTVANQQNKDNYGGRGYKKNNAQNEGDTLFGFLVGSY